MYQTALSGYNYIFTAYVLLLCAARSLQEYRAQELPAPGMLPPTVGWSIMPTGQPVLDSSSIGALSSSDSKLWQVDI